MSEDETAMELTEAQRRLETLERRLQVEEALDRVRARALAMRHSDELASVAAVMLREEQALGIESRRSGIGIVTEDETRANVWTASTTTDGKDDFKLAFHIPMQGHSTVDGLYAAWKNQDDWYLLDLFGDDLTDFLQFVEERGAGPFPQDFSVEVPAMSRMAFHFFPFLEGAVSAITAEPLPEAALPELRRLADAFAYAYTRYLDLKQAEAQAREAQIEAALERVRSRSMAMRRSDELSAVASVVFEQFVSLELDPVYAGVAIIEDEAGYADLWLTAFGGGINPVRIQLPLTGHPQVEKNMVAWRRGDPFLSWTVEGKEAVQAQAEAYAAFTGDPHFLHASPAERQEHLEACHKYGTLSIVSFDSIPPETRVILQRFARVFEQTYTRFLDLKKAEEQAREAQIEAALERVRARSLAMRNSDELAEVSVVLFEQLKALGLRFDLTCVCEIDQQTDTTTVWSTDLEGRLSPGSLVVPLNEFSAGAHMYQTWKQCAPEARKGQVIVTEYTGQDLQDIFEWLPTLPDYQDDATAQYYQGTLDYSPTSVIGHDAFFSHGYLTILSTDRFDAAELDILKRFAGVFEQAYVRFLDLKQAEEQAREAQTEAALERVRAKSLAMQRSDALAEVSVVLFEQLDALGLIFDLTCVCIMDEQTDTLTVWPTDLEGGLVSRSFAFPLKEDPMGKKMYQAWQQWAPEARKGHVMVTEYTGRDLEELLVWFSILSDDQDDAATPHYRETPERVIAHDTYFSHGWLSILSVKPFDAAELDISKRFAGVFEQAYVRFLDLKQAEEQAREAQIEAALERVRARALAMHSSDDLASIIKAVFEELHGLGIEVLRSGIGIMDEQAHEAEVWAVTTTVDGEATLRLAGRISMDGHVNLKGAFEAWKRREPMYAYDLAGDDLKQYMQAVVPPGYGLPAWEPGSSEAFPMRQWFHFFPFPEGALFVVDAASLPAEARQVLRRLTDTFAFAYTRYLDLKQAEARAREAVRDASLDRVRAEIATMRNADDLERIIPLVWGELTTLGVPFFRCGVIIINEARAETEMFLSNNYGTQLAVLQLSFDSHPFIQNAVDAWRNRQVFTDQWPQERLVKWVQFLLDRGKLGRVEEYMDRDGSPPMLALHLVPFAQGLFYVGSAEPLAEEQVDLVQALADAFAVAYARYEDFKRLEAAKADVEATLDHLKTTQAQLIQSEKMASLGQLTAGIAHEIKNPLNFVNNFAEISGELVDELGEEIESLQQEMPEGVTRNFKEILTDLKLNAQKINEHGRRADGIVRAMMQHARGGEGERRAIDVNALLEEYINLAYHGMRASTPDFNVTIERDFDDEAGLVEMTPQEIGRVFINLLNNAFYAVHQKAAAIDGAYAPVVSVSTRRAEEAVEIRIGDNGPGIPKDFRKKIFEPFYTTKPTGEGTGLGLSLSYDIITQGHGGTMTVDSEEGEGATFVVSLPGSPAS